MSLKTSKQERTYLSFDYQYETTFIHSDPKDDTSRKPSEYQRQLKNQHRKCIFSRLVHISKRPSVIFQMIDVITHQSKDG